MTTVAAPERTWARYASGTEAEHFAWWCDAYLVQSVDQWDGLPLVLEGWQREFMGEALAVDANEDPYWSSAVLVVARKNGKSAMLAAFALYRLLNEEGSPEILLAASSDRQAGRLFDMAVSFVRRNRELATQLHLREHIGEIARVDGGGKVIRCPSDPNTLHGYNPSLVICDELHAWTKPTQRKAWAALTTGGGARKRTQVFTITTAGEASERPSSILGRLIDGNEGAGELEERPGLTVSRNAKARVLIYNYSAPTRDPADLAAMKLANPASWITEEYLDEQANDPELTTSEVLQLHGCVWAETETTWILFDVWADRACGRELQPGERGVLGFDGSERRDTTVLAFSTLDGFVTVLRSWPRPKNADETWRVPRKEVHRAVAEAMSSYDVLELAPDPPGWYSEIDEWLELYDDRVVDFDTKKTSLFAPACERFRTDTLEGVLSHDGGAELAAHVAHAVAAETPWGVVIRKDHDDSPRKIDCAVACVIAYDRAMWHAANAEAGEIMVAYG